MPFFVCLAVVLQVVGIAGFVIADILELFIADIGDYYVFVNLGHSVYSGKITCYILIYSLFLICYQFLYTSKKIEKNIILIEFKRTTGFPFSIHTLPDVSLEFFRQVQDRWHIRIYIYIYTYIYIYNFIYTYIYIS